MRAEIRNFASITFSVGLDLANRGVVTSRHSMELGISKATSGVAAKQDEGREDRRIGNRRDVTKGCNYFSGCRHCKRPKNGFREAMLNGDWPRPLTVKIPLVGRLPFQGACNCLLLDPTKFLSGTVAYLPPFCLLCGFFSRCLLVNRLFVHCGTHVIRCLALRDKLCGLVISSGIGSSLLAVDI